MVTTALLGALALGQAQPVTLGRVFRPGQKLTYQVESNLLIEHRQEGLDTFMPEDLDISYSFTTEVKGMKADGIAVLAYRRPTVTVVQGEQFDSGPKSSTEKPNYDFLLTVSPINEIIEFVDRTPQKRAKWTRPAEGAQGPIGGPLGEFIQEIYRLALFTGNFDSALDFSPKLPFNAVKPGDTWQRTAGYQPQKLKGAGGKAAVQRLDYTYTYKGLVTVNGKPFHRVQADLKLNTDLAAFANQFAPPPEEGEVRLARLPLHLDATIHFDLDPKSGHTVLARAESKGGYTIALTDQPSVNLYEEKLRGRTTMRLVSVGTAAPAKPPAPKKRG